MRLSPVVNILCLAVSVFSVTIVPAREKVPVREQRVRPLPARAVSVGTSRGVSRAPAATETTWLGIYNFDGIPSCVSQGWTTADLTAQTGTYTHVDDFVGLGGGNYGLLTPLEGAQSMWCGARPDFSSEVLCGYASLPGYGNHWNQGIRTTSCQTVSGDVVVDYLFAWHSEPTYDYTFVEYDLCDDQWAEIASFDFGGRGFFTHVVDDSLHSGNVRWRFRFVADGSYSDQDGLYDSDGAFIVDSLTVRDGAGVVLDTESFEIENVGAQATVSGNWESFVGEAYGDFAGLFGGLSTLNEDPCQGNLTCLWGFFKGSEYDYSCGGHPDQAVVPYENSRGQYLHNQIWSPVIPLTGSGSEINFDCYLYVDGGLGALIGMQYMVRSYIGSCPLDWQWDEFWYYSPNPKEWYRAMKPLGTMIAPGATAIQLALGAQDICPLYCGILGTGECHSHAPLFDDIRIYRVNHIGPQWVVLDEYTFQDNFASDGTTTGTARADMAADVATGATPAIQPGDSAVVTVADPVYGLATDPYTGAGPALYTYVAVSPPGQPGKSGDALSGDAFRWPVVDSIVHNGTTWYVIRMDTVFTGTGRQGAVLDKFCVDLNDNLFTPGDTIHFVFGATSAGPSNPTTYARAYGKWDELSQALDGATEFTVLPAGGWQRGGDILYVCGVHRYSEEDFMVNDALERVGILDKVDRFDIRYPEGGVGNRLGSRVVDVSQQLVPVYRRILWCTGWNRDFTIGDGIKEKSDDATLLYEFLDQLPESGGVYFNGDRIADGWTNLTGSGAVALRNFLGYSLVDTDHIAYGLGFSPYVVGEPGSFFTDGSNPDSIVAHAGCPYPRGYDVIAPVGSATLAASYSGRGSNGGAIVSQSTLNTAGANVGAVLSGFSFAKIRDTDAIGYPMRAQHLTRILEWLGSPVPEAVAVEPGGYRNSLSQNHPNPFNPATTVTFSLAQRGPVSLRIYNVAGQLVRTLVQDVRSPGVTHSVEWNGRNDAGAAVSSGVYFYRLVARDFVQTRKMVLIK